MVMEAMNTCAVRREDRREGEKGKGRREGRERDRAALSRYGRLNFTAPEASAIIDYESNASKH